MSEKQEKPESATVTLKPGEYLFKETMGPNAIYIIKEGQLKVYKNKDGMEIPVAVIGPGEYVGETAILLGKVYTSSVVAVTDVTALKIPRELLANQLEASPKWFSQMVKGLAMRLQKTNEMLKRNNVVDSNIESQVKALNESSKRNKLKTGS